MPERDKFFYSRVHIGKFDYTAFFYFFPKNWPLEKFGIFWEIDGKWLFIQDVKTILLPKMGSMMQKMCRMVQKMCGMVPKI